MVTIDLITGFLGSGKTSFLKAYARYFMNKGMRVGILENDFGAINVDMLMLNELRGDQCELEMIAGGCDAQSHRRRFRTKLISMSMSGYDRVLVEPSGIFDVDEFFDVLRDEPLDQWYQIGNVIAVVDAGLGSKLSEESNYLLASEVANAGKLLFSHIDEVSEKQAQETLKHLQDALVKIRCPRVLDPEKDVVFCNLQTISDRQLDQLAQSGYCTESYRKMDLGEYKGFDSLYFMEEHFTKKDLEERLPQLFQDPAYGKIFRIKGFIKEENQWLELNATESSLTWRSVPVGQEVLIVIGESLQKEKITRDVSSVTRSVPNVPECLG